MSRRNLTFLDVSIKLLKPKAKFVADNYILFFFSFFFFLFIFRENKSTFHVIGLAGSQFTCNAKFIFYEK